MNMFTASDEIASAIHLQIRYDNVYEQVYCYSYGRMCFVLEMNIFWRPTSMRFVLVETNTLMLETNMFKTCVRILVTHIANYQRLPSRTYLYTYIELTLKNVRFHAGKIRKLCR